MAAPRVGIVVVPWRISTTSVALLNILAPAPPT